MSRTAALLASAALIASCSSGPPARTIRVELRGTRFVPDSISARRGEKVRFVIVNRDPIDHEFVIGDEATQQKHAARTQARHHGAKAGAVDVPSGETAMLEYTFPRNETRLLIGCHVERHYDAGMRGAAKVG